SGHLDLDRQIRASAEESGDLPFEFPVEQSHAVLAGAGDALAPTQEFRCRGSESTARMHSQIGAAASYKLRNIARLREEVVADGPKIILVPVALNGLDGGERFGGVATGGVLVQVTLIVFMPSLEIEWVFRRVRASDFDDALIQSAQVAVPSGAHIAAMRSIG